MTESAANPTGQVTVFFTADGPAETQVRRFSGDWCASGIVDESLWVSSSTWRAMGLELHDLNAVRIGAAGETSDRLLSILASVPLDHLRVVILHLIAPDHPADPDLSRLADTFLHRLADYMPARTPLRAVNLIVPASGTSVVPSEVLLESPHAGLVNVVVSPEDRVSDRSISVGIRAGKEGNLEGHAALAAVTAGGLWTGMAEGPFDERPYPSVAGEHVIVSRCFAAAVQVEPVIDAVSEKALRPRHEWPVPDGEAPMPPIPALDPPRLVERMVDQCGTLADEAFRYRPYQPPAPPPPRTISIWGAFVALFRFLWQGLLRLPREVGHMIKTAASEKAERFGQAMTFGEGSGVAVRLGRRGLPETSLSVSSLLVDASRVLEVAGILGESYAPPNPELWRTLRGLAFGLVDGSDLPAPFERPMAGDRLQVLTDTRNVAPDPFDPENDAARTAVATGLGVASVDLPCCDPYAARQAKVALEQRLAEVNASEEGSAKQRKADAARIQDGLAALGSWVQRHSTALMWRLAERTAVEIERARRDLDLALQELARLRDEDDDTRVVAAWRRCKRRWLLTILLAGLGIFITWQAALSMFRSYEITAGIAVVSLGLVVLAFFAYRRVVFQHLNRAEQIRFALTVAYEQAVRAAHEIVRLGSLYAQLADWGHIIGGIVNRPWGLPRTSSADISLPRDTGLPKALSIAAGRTGEDQRAALASGAARELFDRGWVTDAYQRFMSSALDRFAVQEALSSRPDADADTPQATNGARNHLKQEIAGERHGGEAFVRGRSKVAAFMRQQVPAKLVTEICPIEPQPDPGEHQFGAGVAPEDFFGRVLPSDDEQFLLKELWTEKAETSMLHRVESCHIWAPDGVGPVTGDTKVEWRHMAEVEIAGGGLSLKAVRLDCSPPCTSSDLRIFTAKATVRTVFAPGPGDDD